MSLYNKNVLYSSFCCKKIRVFSKKSIILSIYDKKYNKFIIFCKSNPSFLVFSWKNIENSLICYQKCNPPFAHGSFHAFAHSPIHAFAHDPSHPFAQVWTCSKNRTWFDDVITPLNHRIADFCYSTTTQPPAPLVLPWWTCPQPTTPILIMNSSVTI